LALKFNQSIGNVGKRTKAARLQKFAHVSVAKPVAVCLNGRLRLLAQQLLVLRIKGCPALLFNVTAALLAVVPQPVRCANFLPSKRRQWLTLKTPRACFHGFLQHA
jgi:hypothetical protein